MDHVGLGCARQILIYRTVQLILPAGLDKIYNYVDDAAKLAALAGGAYLGGSAGGTTGERLGEIIYRWIET